MVYRHEPSWCIGANGQRGGVDFAQSFRDQKQLRRVARIAAKPETAVSPLKDPATPQRAIAVPECSHAPVLCRNGGQGYPLPGDTLPPVELNDAPCSPAAKPLCKS